MATEEDDEYYNCDLDLEDKETLRALNKIMKLNISILYSDLLCYLRDIDQGNPVTEDFFELMGLLFRVEYFLEEVYHPTSMILLYEDISKQDKEKYTTVFEEAYPYLTEALQESFLGIWKEFPAHFLYDMRARISKREADGVSEAELYSLARDKFYINTTENLFLNLFPIKSSTYF